MKKQGLVSPYPTHVQTGRQDGLWCVFSPDDIPTHFALSFTENTYVFESKKKFFNTAGEEQESDDRFESTQTRLDYKYRSIGEYTKTVMPKQHHKVLRVNDLDHDMAVFMHSSLKTHISRALDAVRGSQVQSTIHAA